MLSLDCLIPIEESPESLNYEIIDNQNIHNFKQQNSLLFPVTYPDSFYRNVLYSLETSAYLGNHLWTYIIHYNSIVSRNNICIGSVSTRLEPLSRWNEIREGKTVDNFNPVSSTENGNFRNYLYSKNIY